MMLLPHAVKIYISTQPTNLRQSFDGLSIQVRAALAHDPLSGHVFVFLNRRKTQVRLLWWTRGGFAILAKRLEAGTFTFPQQVTSQSKCIEVKEHELSLLLEGIDVARGKFSHRWEPALPDKST
jgi:transposase